MVRLWINMETVAVVRPKSRGEGELDVPGVREHGHDVGEGQLKLLLADGGVAGPGQVTAEAASINRLGGSQIRISGDNVIVNNSLTEENTALLTSDVSPHSLSSPKLHN